MNNTTYTTSEAIKELFLKAFTEDIKETNVNLAYSYEFDAYFENLLVDQIASDLLLEVHENELKDELYALSQKLYGTFDENEGSTIHTKLSESGFMQFAK